MAMSLKDIKTKLGKGYRYRDKAARDVRALVTDFPALKVKDLSNFVRSNGSTERLLSLSGTIPVKIRGTTYNIPIVIWLQNTHPQHPPMVYVTPTSKMRIKRSQFVDANGQVYLPYLPEWKMGTSDLTALCQILCATFTDHCPVYTELTQSQRQPQSPVRPPISPQRREQSPISSQRREQSQIHVSPQGPVQPPIRVSPRGQVPPPSSLWGQEQPPGFPATYMYPAYPPVQQLPLSQPEYPSSAVYSLVAPPAAMSEGDILIQLHGQFGYQYVQVHTSQVLGTGSYGSVVKATLDHLPCAAKILHQVFFRSDDPGQADFTAHFYQECRLLRDLKHPCIVQFLVLVVDPHNRRPILLMELMEESLTHFLERSPNPLPYYVQVNITHDISLALAYLHANRVVHRDLSSNNVLINAGSRAKVTDFGLSKIVDVNPRMTCSRITQCPGTPVFMPPEALRAKPRYSDKLDTFSTGVLIIQIITRKFPAPTEAERVMDDFSSPTGEKIIPVPELERRENDISKVPSTHPLLPTIRHCIKDRDRERPSAAQLCQKLAELKAAPEYEESKRESQQQMSMYPETSVSLETRQREVEELEQRMQQLATECHAEGKSKEREAAELKQQLESLQMSLKTATASSPDKVVADAPLHTWATAEDHH